jgi:hypothetical protein
MTDERLPAYRNLYRRLLTLYPRAFRDQLGESMEQTFADLCNERQTSGQLFGFVLWTFAETSAGIIRENLELNQMKNVTNNPHLAAITGLLFVLPSQLATWPELQRPRL